MRATSTRRPRPKPERGFTIIELIVVITVLGILIGLVLNTLANFYISNQATLTQTIQSSDSRNALRTIENDLTNTDGFLTTTSMDVETPNGSDDDEAPWDYKGNGTNRILIAKVYATDLPSTDPARQLAYLDDGGCADLSTATPAQVNLVYFVKEDPNNPGQYNLYRRTMLPTEALCGTGTYHKQTCASNKISENPSLCQASDAVLLYNIKSFAIDYYTEPTSQTTIPDQYSTGDITTARSIRVTITATRQVNGVAKDFTDHLRLSAVN